MGEAMSGDITPGWGIKRFSKIIFYKDNGMRVEAASKDGDALERLTLMDLQALRARIDKAIEEKERRS
jgi:hypothetical protein